MEENEFSEKNVEAESSTETKTNKKVYKNEVTLMGEIKKINCNDKVAVVTLSTRVSLTYSNYPSVFFFSKENVEKVKQFKVGDRVEVKGTISSYDEKTLKKKQSPVIITGLSLAPAPLPPELSTPDSPIESSYCNDENRFELCGQIMGIDYARGDDVYITIRTLVNGRWSIVKYPYLVRNKKLFLPQIHVSQWIRAVGVIQTANIPIEPDTLTEKDKVALVENGSSVKADILTKPRYVRTKKTQMYILYDIFA